MAVSTQHADPGSRATELAEARTTLAAQRTAMAASRSLMAWVRTGLSMIGFGFTIYKYLQGLSDALAPARAQRVGLFLIGWGTLSIVLGCVEYFQFSREARRVHRVAMRRFPLVLAGVIGFLGVALFLGVITRVF